MAGNSMTTHKTEAKAIKSIALTTTFTYPNGTQRSTRIYQTASKAAKSWAEWKCIEWGDRGRASGSRIAALERKFYRRALPVFKRMLAE